MTKRQRPHRDTKSTLELFIEKAEKARDIFLSLVDHSVGFTSPLEVTRNSEDEEWHTHLASESLLPTFRMFIQAGDGIAIYVVTREGNKQRPAFLDLPGTSERWRKTVEQAYRWIDDLLTTAPPNHTHNDEPITRWKVLETFIFGESLHTTQRETLLQWRQNPDLYGDLLLTYTSTIAFMLEQITMIAEASKEELNSLATNEAEPRRPSIWRPEHTRSMTSLLLVR